MFVLPQVPGLKKSVTNHTWPSSVASPAKWVWRYKSFAEAMLKGAPYNDQVFEFVDSMDYCPEDYRAVELIRIGRDDCSRPHWNSALKIVCRNAFARAGGEFRPPSDHEVQLGLRAQTLSNSLRRLSDGPLPPKLTRQCAANPELQRVHRLTLKAELDIARETNYYKLLGLADEDCDSKWQRTLQELKHSGDLIMPDKSHKTFYRNTNRWYKTSKDKTLLDILHRPLRFPIELFVNPNRTLVISQRPVRLSPPASVPFVPIGAPNNAGTHRSHPQMPIIAP